MKQKFSSAPTTSVTFYRGEESVTLELVALPLGYREYLSSVFPAPVEYVNGVAEEKEDPDYWGLYGYLAVAKALEPSGVLETTAPTAADRAAWDRYARALREEFQAAHITAGEVADLMAAVGELDRAQRKPDQKRAVGNA